MGTNISNKTVLGIFDEVYCREQPFIEIPDIQIENIYSGHLFLILCLSFQGVKKLLIIFIDHTLALVLNISIQIRNICMEGLFEFLIEIVEHKFNWFPDLREIFQNARSGLSKLLDVCSSSSPVLLIYHHNYLKFMDFFQ